MAEDMLIYLKENNLLYFKGHLYVEKIINNKVYYFALCTEEKSKEIWGI